MIATTVFASASVRRLLAAGALAAVLAGLAAPAMPALAGGCGACDDDGDGLTNEQEYAVYGTDVYAYDTDGDNVNDGLEVYYGSNPLVPDYAPTTGNGAQNLPNLDSDQDGLTDADEVGLHGTDPYAYDTDGDGLGDGTEFSLPTNPLSYDTDGDGVDDGSEVNASTDPLDAASRPGPKG